MKRFMFNLGLIILLLGFSTAGAFNTASYTIGVNDVITINILQPDTYSKTVTVSPDGTITYPYVGSVKVEGFTLPEIKEKIEKELADGYMKYPVILVTLEQSRSRQYLVYGEVMKPGTYPLGPNSSVLRAISVAGGFTKFGSSSNVKVLRPRKDAPGYNNIKINIKDVMNGDSEADILLKPGDMVVVSEGVF